MHKSQSCQQWHACKIDLDLRSSRQLRFAIILQTSGVSHQTVEYFQILEFRQNSQNTFSYILIRFSGFRFVSLPFFVNSPVVTCLADRTFQLQLWSQSKNLPGRSPSGLCILPLISPLSSLSRSRSVGFVNL